MIGKQTHRVHITFVSKTEAQNWVVKGYLSRLHYGILDNTETFALSASFDLFLKKQCGKKRTSHVRLPRHLIVPGVSICVILTGDYLRSMMTYFYIFLFQIVQILRDCLWNYTRDNVPSPALFTCDETGKHLKFLMISKTRNYVIFLLFLKISIISGKVNIQFYYYCTFFC